MQGVRKGLNKSDRPVPHHLLSVQKDGKALYRIQVAYTTPWSIMASTTLMNPAILAPAT
ncbi:hypothetical protein SAMN05216233_105172 [Desulfoluna spongiiphila]|uniref:Uncharacterized protein n=1 Tax=Desulfoluna spongiiphila TaxID=419481 RepID=A0A1G5E4Q9_9BACT|nr:hypothetical protein SAMN05216233_105172 [Desulfoluna spongiiphila]VVS91594.1 hypothetical protein DBB_11620 [Desulfoluna spongiiphila]